jgi:hypothetical protein
MTTESHAGSWQQQSSGANPLSNSRSQSRMCREYLFYEKKLEVTQEERNIKAARWCVIPGALLSDPFFWWYIYLECGAPLTHTHCPTSRQSPRLPIIEAKWPYEKICSQCNTVPSMTPFFFFLANWLFSFWWGGTASRLPYSYTFKYHIWSFRWLAHPGLSRPFWIYCMSHGVRCCFCFVLFLNSCLSLFPLPLYGVRSSQKYNDPGLVCSTMQLLPYNPCDAQVLPLVVVHN